MVINKKTTTNYMKNLSFILTFSTILFVACGGNDNDVEAKKNKLEKLKAQQAEIAAEIKTLQEEIVSAGAEIVNKEKTVNVSFSEVKPTTYRHYIDVQGSVDGEENATISARVPAVVTKVLVKPGDKVKAGQVLALLDGEAVRKQLQSLETNYLLVKDLFEKQQKLWDQKIGSEIQYKQAKTQKESMEQQIAAMKEQLEMYKITTEVSGTVDMVNLKIGQMAAPGMPYFTVVNQTNLKVKANVSEIYASRITKGNKVMVYFPDIDKTIESTISYSGKGINLINRTIGIEVNLPSNEAFIPNMVAVIKIVDYENNNAIVVPVNCIQYNDGKSHVFVVEQTNNKNIARKRELTIGSTYNDLAEVKSGLNANDKLITVGFSDLNDGETIAF